MCIDCANIFSYNTKEEKLDTTKKKDTYYLGC